MATRKHYEEIARVRDSAYARIGPALTMLGWAFVGCAMAYAECPPGVAAVLLIPFSLPMLPLLWKREVTVDSEALHAKFDWVNRGKIEIPLGEIAKHRIAQQPANSQWSQQEKDDIKKVRVLYASVKEGVMITLHSGARIWIASDHGNRFNRTIGTAMNRHQGRL